MDVDKLIKGMTNQTPKKEQLERIENVRESYKNVIYMLNGNCKDSRYLLIAITELQSSLHWAVKSIVLETEN